MSLVLLASMVAPGDVCPMLTIPRAAAAADERSPDCPCHGHQLMSCPQQLACCHGLDLLPSHLCKIHCRIERAVENKP